MNHNIPKSTNLSFAITALERSIRDLFSVRAFGKEEIKKTLEFFKKNPPECAFCGSQELKQWDHLIPVVNGGETVLGNMVPSCTVCAKAKRDLPYDEFLRKDHLWRKRKIEIEEREDRIRIIRNYIDAFHYTPKELLDRLTNEEKAKLRSIQSHISELREEIEMLADSYITRVGSELKNLSLPVSPVEIWEAFVNKFDQDEVGYFNWLKENPNGFVLNTMRSRPAYYVIMHRSSCNKVTKYSWKAKQGAFTERQNYKICASEIGRLEEWAKEYNKPDGTRIFYCDFCRP